MRAAFYLGRFCLRQTPQRLSAPCVHNVPRRTRPGLRWQAILQGPPKPRGVKIKLLAALSPGAFIALSEVSTEDGKTPEEHMLEASRAELVRELPDDVHGLRRLWRFIYINFDQYILEPCATTLRFFHLMVIFLPLIAAVPAVWVGPRKKDHNDERAGTLWWYSFLVHCMERAGPAFIKVSPTSCPWYSY